MSTIPVGILVVVTTKNNVPCSGVVVDKRKDGSEYQVALDVDRFYDTPDQWYAASLVRKMLP